jgi:hypothetical protein
MIIGIGSGTMGEPVYTVGMEGTNLSVGKKEVEQEVRQIRVQQVPPKDLNLSQTLRGITSKTVL